VTRTYSRGPKSADGGAEAYRRKRP
jgi:hypothetical protein